MRFGWGIEGLLWGTIFCLLLILPLMFKVLSKTTCTTFSKGFSKDSALMMVRYGFPVVIGNLAAWILRLSDRYILELFRGSYEVGIYSISYGISAQTIGLLSSLFVLSVGPIGMKIWEYKGQAASEKFISKTARYSLIMYLPCCVGLSILAKQILQIFAVADYINGYKIMPFVVFGAFFFNFRGRFLAGLLYHKKTNLIMVGTLLAALTNIVLNFIFIPQYGYVAAAATTFVSYLLLFVVIMLLSRRFFTWDFPFKTLFNTILASGLMGVIIYSLKNTFNLHPIMNVIGLILIGVFTYSLSLLLLKEIRENELMVVKNLIGKMLLRH